MNISFSTLSPHLIYSFKNEVELLRSIEEISEKFTTNRDKISDYLKEPRLVAAYSVFYLLTNIPKLGEVLKWLPKDWVNLLKDCDFIDMGAGPGTFSLAWKNLGGEGEFYQIEQSKLMKDQGRKIWEAFCDKKLSQSSHWEWKGEGAKFMLFGHSANEMGVDVVLKYIETINPEHILFIEPGTKDFFSKMLDIRSHLLTRHYNVLYPCPGPGECPMKGDKDWCHQFIRIDHGPEIERMSQMIKKDRKLMPLTIQAFSRTFKRQNPEERIVRVLPETKFSHDWQVCHSNNLEHYQLMKRDIPKATSKMLSDILAGEAVETETIKNLENATRVKLLKIIKDEH